MHSLLSRIPFVPNLAAMKLPGPLFGFALATLVGTLPACTCNPSEAPAPAAPETAQAATEAAPAGSAPRARMKLQRMDKEKIPVGQRLEYLRPMLMDGGAPKGDGVKPANSALQAPKAAASANP